MGEDVKKTSQVQREIQQMQKEVEQVSINISKLRERFSAVLDIKPSVAGSLVGGGPIPNIVTLADEIRSQRTKLERCNGDLMEIMSACEL